MLCAHGKRRHGPRRAVATVEMALLLPFLAFLFVVAVDYARIFYFAVTLENCARNGAYYASNYPNSSYLYNDIYGYQNLDEAVLKDATNLSPAPTYVVEYSASPDGPFTSTVRTSGYLRLTVDWRFQSLTRYPGIPSTVDLSRSVIMQIAPTMPTFPP
jgi:Flp pilus assembly protein TadG